MLRIHSLRFRIAFAYIVGTLLVSGAIAVGTFAITSIVLTRQEIQSAKSRSFDEMSFIQSSARAGTRTDLSEQLAPLVQRGTTVVVTGPDIDSQSTDVGVTEEAIPAALREAVEDGKVAYITFNGPDHRLIAFGTYLPGSDPEVNAFFLYSLERVDRTLSLLWRVLLGLVLVAIAVAGAVGLRLAERTIRPLRLAAQAARRVAAGHLQTRLTETGEDELSRLAGAFNQMTEALEDRIMRERRFVSDASHELRTPLTALKTSVDYLADRSEELPPRLRSAAGLAAEEVRALQRLVDDLLELSKAEAGGVSVSVEDVDLVNFAGEVARRRAPATDVEIVAPDHLIVRTDKARLERVVGNLLENAAFHGGGHDVTITLAEENGAARITVTDRGPGIEPAQLQRIFERFWRGDASRRRDGRVGAGLGLAIARENAGLLGADLHVSSESGVGTAFEVVLPEGEEA